MTEAPAFTVLIPTHNRPDVLPFAIRSVLAQTLGDLELLVVGDGCTDETGRVVEEFADPRIRWFDFPKGPHFGYANRNRALREARGEVVAYLGHDDLWLPDHLELIAWLFADSRVELAYTRPLLVSSEGVIRPLALNLEDPLMLTRFKSGRLGLGFSPAAHRRACFEKYGYLREDLPRRADTDLWRRIVQGGEGENVAYCGIPTSVHFRANWRKEAPGYRHWLRLRRREGSIQPDLSISVERGQTQQEAVWRELEADPDGWTERLRRAVRIELDRLARAEYASFLIPALYQQYTKLSGGEPWT